MDKDISQFVPLALHYWTVGGLAGGFLLVATSLALYIKKMQREHDKLTQENLVVITEEATKSRIALEHNTRMFEKLYAKL